MKGQGDENKYRENGVTEQSETNWSAVERRESAAKAKRKETEYGVTFYRGENGSMEVCNDACPCHHTIFQIVSPASTGTYLEPFQRLTYQLIVFGLSKWQTVTFLSVFVVENDVFSYFSFLSVWIYIPVGDLWVGCSSYNFNVIDYSVS